MKIIYISFHGPINPTSAQALEQTCANIVANEKPHKLYFLFSSGGGSVESGMALYGFFRALPVALVMHNIGSVESVANAIFLAADERFAAPHSMFLLHGLSWGYPQGANLTWTQMQENASRFKADEERLRGVITSRTTITKDEVTALFHQGETKDLAFAKEKGVIQDIVEAKVPPGQKILTLSFV